MVQELNVNLTRSQCHSEISDMILGQLNEGEGQPVTLNFLIDTQLEGRTQKLKLSSGKHIRVNRQFLKKLTDQEIQFNLN